MLYYLGEGICVMFCCFVMCYYAYYYIDNKTYAWVVTVYVAIYDIENLTIYRESRSSIEHGG